MPLHPAYLLQFFCQETLQLITTLSMDTYGGAKIGDIGSLVAGRT